MPDASHQSIAPLTPSCLQGALLFQRTSHIIACHQTGGGQRFENGVPVTVDAAETANNLIVIAMPARTAPPTRHERQTRSFARSDQRRNHQTWSWSAVSAAEQIIDHAAVKARFSIGWGCSRSADQGQPLDPPDPQSHCPWPQRFRVVGGLLHHDFGRFWSYGGFKAVYHIVSGGFFTKENEYRSVRAPSVAVASDCANHDVEEEVLQALPWRQLKHHRALARPTRTTAAAADPCVGFDDRTT